MKSWQENGAVNMGGNFKEDLSFSSSPRGAERRRAARLGVVDQQLVTINLGADNGGLLLDLSTGGVAIQTVAPLKRGTTSPFAFRLPQSESEIEGTGVFVWVDETKLAGGLRFDELSPQGKRLLVQWLKNPPPDPSSAAEESGREEVPAAMVPKPSFMQGELSPTLAAMLLRMAERARLISRATGACIALKDEEEVFFCQASIGTAPDVGVRVNLERGLAAECISSKDMILCNEAQSDPRVDVATRQQLRLGSAVLLPLFAEETLFGVLSVFSDRPHAFGEQQIVRLHDCARTMEKGILRELRGEPEAIPVLPPAVVVLPTQDLTDAEPPDERNRSGHSILRIIVSAVLLCGLLASGVILYQRGIFAPAMPVALKPLVPKPLVPEPTRSQEEVSKPPTQAGSNLVTTPMHPQTATADKPRQQAPYVPVDTFRIYAPKEQRLTEQSPDSAAATKAQDVPVTPAPSAPPSVSRPPVNEAPGPKASTAQQKELQPNPAATPPPSTLAAPPPPVTHVEVLTEVLKTSPTAGPAASTQIPEPESTVKILYPAAAVAQKRQGSVVLRVTVGPAGTVNNIRVLDGDPILSNEAVGAVRQWRYRSTGSDASTELLMTVNFVLSR